MGQPRQTRQGEERCIKPGPGAEHLPAPLLCHLEGLRASRYTASGPKSPSQPLTVSSDPQVSPRHSHVRRCSESAGKGLKFGVSVSLDPFVFCSPDVQSSSCQKTSGCSPASRMYPGYQGPPGPEGGHSHPGLLPGPQVRGSPGEPLEEGSWSCRTLMTAFGGWMGAEHSVMDH